MNLDPRRLTGWGVVLLAGLALDRSALTAQGPPNRLAPADVFDLEFASAPEISPDGSAIVYQRERADIVSDARYSNLWLVRADGSGDRPLTTGNFSDMAPAWSPDGRRILFVSNRENSFQIWVYSLDRDRMTRITDVERFPWAPVWSPDGRTIAFTSVVPRRLPPLANVPSPPSGAQWAPPARVFDRLVYRFDGVGELEPGWSHIFVVSADGGVARRISSGDFDHGGGPGHGFGAPVWTPDGQYILFSTNRRTRSELASDTEIYEFAVSSGAVRALTDRRGPDDVAAVSPDGRWIAYTGMDDRYQGHQTTQLYLMNRDGSGAHPLLPSFDRDVSNPRWLADGSGIVVQFDDQGTTRIGLVGARGGEVRRLAENVGGGSSWFSAYSLGASYSLARSGRIAYTYTTPLVPSQVAVAGISESARVVTHLNGRYLEAKRLGQVEEIWYPSSKDGRRIHGWIVKPPGFDPSRKYPLILEIHGGPFFNYGPRFDVEKQAMASAGYVVLYTNPRGSTSYGEEFANLIHHAYPGDDYYDLASGVDAVIAKGYVDSTNLFITGGSGGGVLTAWTIGRTNRFRAAAVLYPVINWFSQALTSDIPGLIIRYWFPGEPWKHPQHYYQRSPISVVGNVRTPTMVLTGEEDYRTPMAESEQYYQALKIAGVDAVLVKVPGEPHYIAQRPSHHMQKIAYILGWFDRFREAPRPASGAGRPRPQ